jgi:DNA-binding CsgD family transcriptional regulator
MLGISVFTVRRHIANLSAKLGLRGTTALVRYAIQHDIVRED